MTDYRQAGTGYRQAGLSYQGSESGTLFTKDLTATLGFVSAALAGANRVLEPNAAIVGLSGSSDEERFRIEGTPALTAVFTHP